MLREDPNWEVLGLVVAFDLQNGRQVPHGLPLHWLTAQVGAVGLTALSIGVDSTDPSRRYEEAMDDLLSMGAESVAFGEFAPSADHVQPLAHIARAGLVPEFPLRGRDPGEHVEVVLRAGVTAWVYAVDTGILGAGQAGQRFDAGFVAGLPPRVCPAGCNGEFRTFVDSAPGWRYLVGGSREALIRDYGLAYRPRRPTPSGIVDPTGRERRLAPSASHDRVQKAFDPFAYERQLRRVWEHVDEHMDKRLTLGALAEIAAMEETSFSRYFRKHVGTNFSTWLGRRRIERAQTFLLASNETIEEVGRDVGFPVARTFRRAFRRHTGCSPSEFRRRHLPSEPPAD